MDAPTKLTLFDCREQRKVIAQISSLARKTAKYGLASWWNGLTDLKANPDEEPDSEWDWVYLISATVQNKPHRRSVSVTTPDGVIQGVMLYRLDAISVLESKKGAIYVDRIATAPHNRGGLVLSPMYRGVGEGLLAYAVAESFFYGLEGRVNLIPVAAKNFYMKRGFIPTDEKADDGDVLYELPVADAKRLLQQRGVL